MWLRRLFVVLLLAAGWLCFWLVASDLDRRIDADCQKLRDLSAECYAPAASFIAIVSVAFVVVTLLLAWLARPRRD